MRSNVALLIGLSATLASALLWHGPGGAAERFVGRVDGDVRTMLVRFEMGHVQGHMQRDPIARRILYSGPADDFQRAELVRIAEAMPGVGEARWSRPRSALAYPLPLLAEAVAMALGAFLAGLTLAYGFSLRNRGEG